MRFSMKPQDRAQSGRRTALIVLACLAMLATACKSGSIESVPIATTTSTTTAPDTSTTSTAPDTAIDTGAVVPEAEPVGDLSTGTISLADGSIRTYHLYVPSTAGTEPIPLLVAMHGGFGSGLQFRDGSGFDRLAEANGFLVVFPDGTPIVAGRDSRVWNGGACCGAVTQDRQNVDDVGFIAAVIDEVSATHAVDPGRVFATGHSNGAIMAYRLACELSDRIAAVAFQAGSLEIDSCQPSRPVSIMHLHGLADTNIPIDGGHISGVSKHEFASPRESIRTMAGIYGCTDQADLFDPSNPDVSGTRWTGCDSDVTIEMVTIEGATHAWMGHPLGRLQQRLAGAPYDNLDSSAVIWSFLANQHRS